MTDKKLTSADLDALHREDGDSVITFDGNKIPKPKFMMTHHANLERLINKFGNNVINTTSKWHSWRGTHWVENDNDIYTYALELPAIIEKEAKLLEGKYYKERIKWATESSMKGNIEAVIGLAKKLLTVSEDKINNSPWLLNCLNGTVDLRTGELLQHNPNDFITKICPINYNKNAKCENFINVIARVCLEEDRETKAVVNFLQRWFGYCATGSVREQKMIVHWGSGSNGKSTIIDIIAHVLGDYSSVAPPGLLMSSGNERHPTEIASLFSKRMVTAHETAEGGTLREDFVKQATGGDKMMARYMREDFFEFSPTHKLQLLTNHKPTIRGQDHAIWRRVLLVPYNASFGDADIVAMGLAKFVKDENIFDNMMKEKEGILAWIVEGAIKWFVDGLQPPDLVVNASKDYKHEQDRILQFIKEECVIGAELNCQLYGKKTEESAFKRYGDWCDDNGFKPLGRNKFGEALERIIPSAKREEKKKNGKDRIFINGLSLKQEEI